MTLGSGRYVSPKYNTHKVIDAFEKPSLFANPKLYDMNAMKRTRYGGSFWKSLWGGIKKGVSWLWNTGKKAMPLLSTLNPAFNYVAPAMNAVESLVQGNKAPAKEMVKEVVIPAVIDKAKAALGQAVPALKPAIDNGAEVLSTKTKALIGKGVRATATRRRRGAAKGTAVAHMPTFDPTYQDPNRFELYV